MARDAALLNMARNALLVAGHEMGEGGDHWPVIKAAVHGLARAYEAMKIEEEVTNQLKSHMKQALDEYEGLVAGYGNDIDEESRVELEKFITGMRGLYSARFDEPAPETTEPEKADQVMDGWIEFAAEAEGMIPWQRAAAIIRTLDEKEA